jgi:drug/metabolite transporter (DMT)-like permease
LLEGIVIYLLLVSFVWAFSFGLIKGNLTGLDSNFVAFCRMLVSLLIFLPFLKFSNNRWKFNYKLAAIGALQFGIMYITYIAAFKTLKAYEVALFTIFTPIYVTLIEDTLQKKFNPLYLLTAAAAVGGTWIIQGQAVLSPGVISGFLLVQISNLCFAFGQIAYRRVMAQEPGARDIEVFGFLYLGATALTLLSTLVFVPISSISITAKQVWTLIFLGAVASGISFFLWNIGARKVNTGALAIFNDLKIPLAVAVSLLVFKEQTNLPNLLIGGCIVIAALILNELLNRNKFLQPIPNTTPLE